MSLDTSKSKKQKSASEPEKESVTGVDEIEDQSVPGTAGSDAAVDGALVEVSGGGIDESTTREDLEYRIADLEGQVEQLRDQLLRRQAELINYRRRVERERGELSKVAQAGVVEKILPVIDDFERAVVADADDVEAYRAGVELILKSLQNLLSGIGVERLEPLHEDFDPEVHEAMARVETAEIPDGWVAEVYLPGYRMGDRLLRPARVAVAARPREDVPETEGASGDSSESDG
jgi:molecular chaperone GrpE